MSPRASNIYLSLPYYILNWCWGLGVVEHKASTLQSLTHMAADLSAHDGVHKLQV